MEQTLSQLPILQILPMLLYAFLSVIDVAALRKKRTDIHRIIKPFLLPMLFLFYIESVTGINSSFRLVWPVAAALAFHWAGDIFMLIANGKVSKWFYASMVSFLIGHLFYFLWIVRFVAQPSVKIIIALTIIILPIYIRLTLFAYDSIGRGRLFKVMMSYAGVLSFLVIGAATTFGKGPLFGTLLTLLGYVLFIFSDAIIASNKVGKPIAGQPMIMGTYTAAEFLIIMGILVLQS